MENEILLKIICNGVLLLTQNQEFTFREKEHEVGKSQNFKKRAGLVCLYPTWSGKVHAFVNLDRISSSR